MKKVKFILGVIAAISTIFAMTSCDLELRDSENRAAISGLLADPIDILELEEPFSKTVATRNAEDADLDIVHSFTIGLMSDGAKFIVEKAKLNDEYFVLNSAPVETIFLNDPSVSPVNCTTDGNDFVVKFLFDCTANAETDVWKPYNFIIQDNDNPGAFGWVKRADDFGFDPLQSYPTVTYEIPNALGGPAANGRKVVAVIEGNKDTITITCSLVKK
jgi:hypothetical protein